MSDPIDWTLARCRGLDTEMFFVERGESYTQAVVDACAECPIRSQCLDWALRHEKLGYWAGTTEVQRRKLRRQMGISITSTVTMAETWSSVWNDSKARIA